MGCEYIVNMNASAVESRPLYGIMGMHDPRREICLDLGSKCGVFAGRA
jgi:hypothetical protein